MIYKEKLKQLKEEYGLKQEELAEILNLTRGGYSHYENEQELMPIKHLITLADYFQISLDYLFSFSEKKKFSYNKTNEKIAGTRLKTWRKENKITQEKLAKILNTNRSVIANYERGRNYIATPFLYTICKKYNVSADYLLGRK